MNWYDAALAIKRAQENNQLVIFVGAGVSANSGIPTWGELIEKIAAKIEYDRCSYCKCKKETCPEEECGFRNHYSQEEFLRIPEYFYQSVGPEEYYRFVKSALQSDNGSNAIDDEVFRVYPHHVITTNYDSLLENSSEANTQKYSVVYEDRGLLANASDQYIIKMHGDLEHSGTIVLRETDYTVYEQNHPLISTFIKALLVNHTFVFIGYSLNDYNLNLIIGWINYFRKHHHIEGGPHSFFITSKPTSGHEKLRLKNEGIIVVDLLAMPEEVLADSSIPASITHDSAKRLLMFLKSITEIKLLRKFATLTPLINELFTVFESYEKISFLDLMSSLSIGRYEMYGDELVMYDESSYDLIKHQYENNPVFQFIFKKTGITRVVLFGSENKELSVLYRAIELSATQNHYLDNNYEMLFEVIEKDSGLAERILYYYILGFSYHSINPILEKEKEETNPNDIVKVLLHRARQWLVESAAFVNASETLREVRRIFNSASPKFTETTKFLHALFYSSEEQLQAMQKQLEKHEERYKHNSHIFISGHAHTNLWRIQAYAYDYYFFMLKNCIPILYFTNAKEYLSYYIRAILCTYSPDSFFKQGDESFFDRTQREPYIINRIDLDIITKYCNSDSLIKWIDEYSVNELKLEDECNIVYLFENLSHSLTKIYNRYWGDELVNLSIIAGLTSTDEQENTKLLLAASSTINLLRDAKRALLDYFPSVYRLVSINGCLGGQDACQSLLRILVEPEIYDAIVERDSYKYQRIINDLSSFCTEEIREIITDVIRVIENSRKKANAVYTFRSVISPEEERQLIGELVDGFSISQLTTLVSEKRIDFDIVKDSIFRSLESSVRQRDAQPDVRVFPDAVQEGIENLLFLYLIGEQFDLSLIEKHKKYSDHLAFMLNPDSFDYSKVDFENYMWQNLIYSPKYKHFFIEHKSELLTDDLEKLLSSSDSLNEVRKEVYGLLLEDKELRIYGG